MLNRREISMPNWKQCSECDKWIVDKQYGMCYDCYSLLTFPFLYNSDGLF